jgi:hypothetical protein
VTRRWARAWWWGSLVACAAGSEPDVDALATCEEGSVLFGVPNERTGLGDDACVPSCASCGEVGWVAPVYDAADVAALRAAILVDPPSRLAADPYGASPTPPTPGAVCGVERLGDGRYRLETFASAADAAQAGVVVTHGGACGACSTLQDLAVYIERPDLTEPVRACGLAHLADPIEDLEACIADLGFSGACAQIWAFNTVHTRTACGGVCLAALDDPYHTPDGALNACLRCDEEESGPVFLAVAGRTRRNTGVPSSMCRPCSEVWPLNHRYGLDEP